jgi:hypothetical protein
MNYRVKKIGSGKRVLWQANMHGVKVTGAGGRPDLAIRDLHEQIRRRERVTRKSGRKTGRKTGRKSGRKTGRK